MSRKRYYRVYVSTLWGLTALTAFLQFTGGDFTGAAISEGEALTFKGIPYFAPELFQRPRLQDPLRAKQLNKGLKELGKEGAIQVFQPVASAALILGAVGELQFDIVAHRLKTEYQVGAAFEPALIYTARWVTCPDADKLREFERANQARLATDTDGNLAYLADSRVNLELAGERGNTVSV